MFTTKTSFLPVLAFLAQLDRKTCESPADNPGDPDTTLHDVMTHRLQADGVGSWSHDPQVASRWGRWLLYIQLQFTSTIKEVWLKEGHFGLPDLVQWPRN